MSIEFKVTCVPKERLLVQVQSRRDPQGVEVLQNPGDVGLPVAHALRPTALISPELRVFDQHDTHNVIEPYLRLGNLTEESDSRLTQEAYGAHQVIVEQRILKVDAPHPDIDIVAAFAHRLLYD